MTSHDRVASVLASIRQSDQFRQWQAALAAYFYEPEQKSALIRRIRKEIAAAAGPLPAEEATRLESELLRPLIALASQAARRPAEPEEPPLTPRSPQEIEDLVVEQYPYPIAVCYQRFLDADPGAGAMGCLLDTLESLLHFLATVVVSAYWRDGAWDVAHNRRLLEKFYKGKWSTGDLMALLRETARLYLDRRDRLPYPQLIGYLFTGRGKPSPSLVVLEGLVEFRNEGWSHLIGRDDAFYAAVLPEHRARLEEELSRCDWLASRTLWLPKAIDEQGRVTSADLLRGSRRRRNRPVELQLAREDLDLHGGDIVPERTLLLVDEAAGNYLPLFPLSLFHFQPTLQGLFFLNDLDWAKQAERLKKARYIAYDVTHGQDLAGSRYEARAGESATINLEAKVRRLAELLGEQGEAIAALEAAVRDVKDYDLPEVWAEMASHLKTFAGRETWMTRLDDWTHEGSEGRYLLLLGPPGQGKSALLAQFAERQRSRGPCLLHMIKSHKDPRRLLQFLLWQAEQAGGAVLDDTAYQGDIDDLRSALFKSLECLQLTRGQAVLVIDALDELDPSGQRLEFLPENLPAGVRVVLSCRPEIPLVAAIQQRLRPLTIESLPPLSADDLPAFLQKYLDAAQQSELQAAIDFAELFRHTGGNPLFLKRAIERILGEVRRAQVHGGPLPKIDPASFPNTVEAVFDDIYNELAEKSGGRYITAAGRAKGRLIQLLAVAREALSVEDLRGLLLADTTSSRPLSVTAGSSESATAPAISLEEVRDLVLQMSEHLLAHDGERFLPFHQGFTDHLLRQVLGDEGTAAAHEVYCRWLSTRPQHRSLYRLRHHPAHVCAWARLSTACGQPGMYEAACRALDSVLGDFEFVQAKVQAEMTFDLIRDYQAALAIAAHPLLESWAQFVNGESHILSRHPPLFFQQALNQPADSPVAEAALARRSALPKGQAFLLWINKPAKATCSAFVRTLAGHTQEVTCVAVSRDGRRVASGDSNGEVKIWDLQTGQELDSFAEQLGRVYAVFDAPDGWRVIAGRRELNDIEKIIGFQFHAQLESWVIAPGFSAGAAAGQKSASFDSHKTGVKTVALAADGKLAISAEFGQQARVWDTSTGRELTALAGHDEYLTALAATSDGRYGFTGDSNGSLKMWDLQTGQEAKALEPQTTLNHAFGIDALAVSPDDRRLLSASYGNLSLRELPSGQIDCVGDAWHGQVGGCSALAISPDGRTAVTAHDYTYRLKVWDLESKRLLAEYPGHTGRVTALAITPDGRHVVSASYDRTLKVWDLGAARNKKPSSAWPGLTWSKAREAVLRFLGKELVGYQQVDDADVLTPDGRFAVESAYCLHSPAGWFLAVWHLRDGALATGRLVHRSTCTNDRFALVAGAATPRREWMILGSQDGKLLVWRRYFTETVQLVELQAHEYSLRCLALDRNARVAVTASGEGEIKIWELCRSQLPHGEPADDYATKPKIWNRIKAVLFWQGKRVIKIDAHQQVVTSLAISSDGRRLVTASADRTLKVWDLNRASQMLTFSGHAAPVASATITPDGRCGISGDQEGTVKVWELETGKELRSLAAHDEGVLAVAVTPHGEQIVTGGKDGWLKVWDFATGQPLAMFPTSNAIAACAVHPSGQIICRCQSKRLYMLRLDRV